MIFANNKVIYQEGGTITGSNNIIKGINHHLIVMSHGRDSHLTFYSFENQYFSDSLIIKRETKETPKVSKCKIVNNSGIG